VGFLDKATKVMEKIADNEADIIEAGGWGNRPAADVIRSKGAKGVPKGSAKGSAKKK
jgi:hypothetical protein